MEYYADSDIGKVREKNQDQATVITNTKDQIVAVVCDGMGGHRAGEIASRVVNDHVITCFNGIPPFESEEEVETWLKDTIIEADAIIKRMAGQSAEHKGMGTTIVIAVVMNNMLYVANVGDSRAYVCKGKKMTMVSKDHTLVNELIERGAISKAEARSHSQRNVLLQAIGANVTIEPYFHKQEFKNSLVMLCSDGLYNSITDKVIKETLNEEGKVTERVRKLIDLANENGGSDNIAVAIIDNREVIRRG